MAPKGNQTTPPAPAAAAGQVEPEPDTHTEDGTTSTATTTALPAHMPVINTAALVKLTDTTDMSLGACHNSIMTALAPVHLTQAAHDRTAAPLLRTAAGTQYRALGNTALGALIAEETLQELVAARHTEVEDPDTALQDLDDPATQLIIWLFVCWRVANPRGTGTLRETNETVSHAQVPVNGALMQVITHTANAIETFRVNDQVGAFNARHFTEQVAFVATWFASADQYVTNVLTHADPRPTTLQEFALALRPYAQGIAAIQFMARHHAEQARLARGPAPPAPRHPGRRAQQQAPQAPRAAAALNPAPAAPAAPTAHDAAGRICRRCNEAHPYGQHTNPTIHEYCKQCGTRHAPHMHGTATRTSTYNSNGATNNGNAVHDSVPA